MNFKSGWCDFCEGEEGGPRCVEVCPTHALSLAGIDVADVVIGKARITLEWCLAAKGMGCHECVDVCQYDAMALGNDAVPLVKLDACNGCGACEFACISLSAGSITTGATNRAITVVPTSEINDSASMGTAS
jgi:ferredoxin-type protein NapG